MPLLPWRQLRPPSSVSQTPTADMAIASLSGSPGQGTPECRHSPPPPGVQLSRVGCSHSVWLSSHVAPSSRLSNSTPGSPPAYSGASPSPAQARPDAPDPLGPAGGQREPLGLRPLARRIVGVEDLRAVERVDRG